MNKRVIKGIFIICIMFMPLSAFADFGNVITKSKDIEISMSGSLKTYPHFMTNVDLNKDKTDFDRILDENGYMKEHAVRNEARVGWEVKGNSWDLLLVLESDFTLNKVNVDRQAGANNVSGAAYNPDAVTANSDDFGIEKLNLGYSFDDYKFNTGWNTKHVDLMTGALIYADDHPYIGFAGKTGPMSWELLYLTIQDDIHKDTTGYNGTILDWRAYTFRALFDVNGFNVAPIYAFSHNQMRDSNAHYLGVEGYGKMGKITPRFELVYALGEKRLDGADNQDISAYAAYASVEIEINDACKPYLGAYYLSGDDDPDDNDINSYNGISMNQRYTPTFGMENAYIYRFVPVLGSNIYENNFQNLGSKAGYGGSSNGQKADAPGLIMVGAGSQGNISENFLYKTQAASYSIAEAKNFKKEGTDKKADEWVGVEMDIQLTYKLNPHLSIGNVLAVFIPGDFVKDYRGDSFNDTAILNTVELICQF